MNIFKHEVSDGLENIIKANTSLAYISQPKLLSEPFQNSISDEKLKNFMSYATNQNQIDLYYLMTVLASTGWNLNEDVFLGEEIWKARSTPVDKQFNHEHDCNDIIGHITSSFILDDKLVLVNASVDSDLPETFHIATGAVLYKVWSDKKKQERMDKLIAEIADNKWFVSMECLFNHFDYAIRDESGKGSIITRSDETSFLTKHLRAYGGNGKYENYKIGRILRNIVFSGKGLVSNPANPNSVILTNTEKFSATNAKIFVINKSLGYINNKSEESVNRESDMSKEVELQKQVDEYKSKADEYQNKASAFLKDLEGNKLQLEKLQIEQKNYEALVASLKEEVKKEKDGNVGVGKELEGVKAELVKAKEELDKINAEKKISERKAKLVKELKIDEVKAVELEKKFNSLNDEAFNTNLEVLAAGLKKDDKSSDSDPKKVLNDTIDKAKNSDDSANAARSDDDSEKVNSLRKAIAERLTKKTSKSDKK